MAARPRLLYCAPVVPALTGNGLAMRAGTVLRALAERYRVSLLAVPLYWSPAADVPPAIAEGCQQVIVAGGAVPAPGASAFGDEPFDVVHVFRLATVKRVRPWVRQHDGRPARHLDLDDVESISRRRIAERYAQTGQPQLASTEHVEADRGALAEAALLREFERIYVCSEGDRRILETRRPAGAEARIEVLPNALPTPETLPPAGRDGPFTFLFVGTLGYFPNEDAIVAFCREALPSLRRMATGPVRVEIVGIGATPAVRALAAIPEVEVVGALDDVAEAYRRAHAAIVPIRAGGGTRIKILEAFAYRRPVVTTSIGIEGIAARHEEHVLIADAPSDFARQCARLIASPGLCERLAREAGALFEAEFSLEALIRRVRALPA
jgi:glycosyltransferase involved in cell wall biosynthesis